MALKKVTVSFPARYAMQSWLNRPRADLRMDSIMKGMELHTKFSLDFVPKWIEKNSDDKGTLRFEKVLNSDVKPLTCRVDEAYLTWLRDQLDAYKWNEMPLPDGRMATIAIPTGLQEGIAALGKAVNEAISGADVEEKAEQEEK